MNEYKKFKNPLNKTGKNFFDYFKKLYGVLYIQVIFAIIMGVILGYTNPNLGESMKLLGDCFIKLVKMIITPVIFLTVTTGIAGMNDINKVGRVASKSMIYFLVFSTLALIIGMIVSHIIQPGKGMNIDVFSLDSSSVAIYVDKIHESTLTGFLINIIPNTLVSQFVSGEILQVLFVSILFGISLAMTGENGKIILRFFNYFSIPIFCLVSMLMRLAPVGAFGSIAFTIGKFGIQSILNLAVLVATFYLTSILFILLVLGSVAKYNNFSILKLIRYIKEELLLVLGTSSSEAALPTLMQKMEKIGCYKSTVGLVIPTGYSFNLDGTNIYMTMAALFIAQACDVNLSLSDQILLLLVAMISSKGAAGVTGAGFITLAATLSVVPTVPVSGMSLILGVDRFMSECRALTNLIGNATATIVISKWEGELKKHDISYLLNNKSK